MAAMSDYTKGKLIAHYLRSGSLSKVGTLYFALFTTATTDAGGGTEVSGGGYQRVGVAASDANFSDQANGDGLSKNQNPILFGYPSTNWGTVTHWAVFDAATAGNMLMHGALTTAQTLLANDPPMVFMPNDLGITFD